MLELQVLVPIVLLLVHVERASVWSSIGVRGYWGMPGALARCSKAALIISVLLAAFGPPWLPRQILLWSVLLPYLGHALLMLIAFERHERSVVKASAKKSPTVKERT
jgi:hypothetical protein